MFVCKMTPFNNNQAPQRNPTPLQLQAVSFPHRTGDKQGQNPPVRLTSNTEEKASGEAIQWVLSYAIHVEKMGTLRDTAQVVGEGMKTLFAMHVEKKVTSQDFAKTEGVEDRKSVV